MKDRPIGKAKRTIKEGEIIQITISGNKVYSSDIALNERGKKFVLGKLDFDWKLIDSTQEEQQC